MRQATFTLTYELARSDLEHTYAADQRWKRRRKNTLAMAVPFLLSALALTGLSVAVSHPARGPGSVGAPGILYVLAAFCWFVAIGLAAMAILLMSPGRLAGSAWRNPQLHGRHQDEVSPAGVTSVSPDGTEQFTPWATIARVRETDDAFFLLGRDGSPQQALLKRGLPSPDQIPSLREFLRRSVGQEPPAAAGTAVGDPMPLAARSDGVPAEHPDGDQRQHGGEGEQHRDGRQR